MANHDISIHIPKACHFLKVWKLCCRCDKFECPRHSSQDLDMIVRYGLSHFFVVYQVHSECNVITPEYSMPVGGALYKSGIVDMIALQ